MTTTLVVASGVGLARCLAEELGITYRAIPCSPASIRRGAGRGSIISAVLIDDTAWPPSPWLVAELRALKAPGARTFRMQRVSESAQPAITELGKAIVESGLTVRQAHELRTGCSESNPCARCVADFGMTDGDEAGP